jgi:hypothetical protein
MLRSTSSKSSMSDMLRAVMGCAVRDTDTRGALAGGGPGVPRSVVSRSEPPGDGAGDCWREREGGG